MIRATLLLYLATFVAKVPLRAARRAASRAGAVTGVIAGLMALPAWAAELVMVEQPGCAYCAAWDRDIAPIYPKTAIGAFAPLRRADLHDGPPAGTTYAYPVRFTPTFILLDDAAAEIGRIEGYPGEDFFWPLLERLAAEKAGFAPGLVPSTGPEATPAGHDSPAETTALAPRPSED
ncbi:hypothetical protein [Pseudooceanicola nitratireducens]|uniref:hypothetical protein n=1 Tax=Pseudooceanicola nitratireducens TaxID=517719 RepID=UPI003C797E35